MFKNREEVLKIKEKYTGKRVYVEINDMYNPTYGEGVVNYVDDAGQLHGTWGSLAAMPGEDVITILD
jgi:hypothetical protein